MGKWIDQILVHDRIHHRLRVLGNVTVATCVYHQAHLLARGPIVGFAYS